MDHFHNSVDFLADFVIPKSEHRVTGLGQRRISQSIALAMSVLVVLTTVHFNDQSRLATFEIGNVSADGRLASEVMAQFS